MCVSWFVVHFRVITKRSKLFLSYWSRYSKITSSIKKNLRCFHIVYVGFFDCLVILSIYLIFGHFRTIEKRSKILLYYSSQYSKFIGAIQTFLKVCIVCVSFIFGHYWAITKRSNVLFCYSSWYYRVIGVKSKNLRHFLYCVCVFLDVSIILGH